MPDDKSSKKNKSNLPLILGIAGCGGLLLVACCGGGGFGVYWGFIRGKAEVKDGSVVIVYQDDRVERWTPVGKRMVVEHWYPGAQFPSGTPVLGIAEVVR